MELDTEELIKLSNNSFINDSLSTIKKYPQKK